MSLVNQSLRTKLAEGRAGPVTHSRGVLPARVQTAPAFGGGEQLPIQRVASPGSIFLNCFCLNAYPQGPPLPHRSK